MFFRKMQPPPETLPQKRVRLLAFHEDMVASATGAIADFRRAGDGPMVLSHYSHLIFDLVQIALMQWRMGDDPRPAIARARAAYRAMVSYREASDPGQAIPMDRIAGITDWDLVYALFWLAGRAEEPLFHFPELTGQRYFAYSRHLLLTLTDHPVAAGLQESIDGFATNGDGMADRDFRDLAALLDPALADAEAADVAARVAANWPRRRRARFYDTSAPLTAGHDVSNDLYLDYQLACVLSQADRSALGGMHAWLWD